MSGHRDEITFTVTIKPSKNGRVGWAWSDEARFNSNWLRDLLKDVDLAPKRVRVMQEVGAEITVEQIYRENQ